MIAPDKSRIVHGVLVNVSGSGVLITGDPGAGKSTCVLELISRGHILIADDVVDVGLVDGKLCGTAPKRLAGLLEVRGLGVIDVRELFGPSAFEPFSTIDVCVHLYVGQLDADPFGREVIDLLGVSVRTFVISIEMGRSLPVLVETAVKLERSTSASDRLIRSHDGALFPQPDRTDFLPDHRL